MAAEIYSKIKNGHNVVDDTQAIVRDVPPFPYRVAKALDPNIYRNTDFDIWHEIRRGNKKFVCIKSCVTISENLINI